MRAYKFLRAGAVGPFSLVAWPRPAQGRPGAWLHACRPADLPHWLSDELWEVELRGPVAAEPIKLVAASGRLVARVECWGPEAAADYADACAARIDLPAYAQDAAADAAAARADASRAPSSPPPPRSSPRPPRAGPAAPPPPRPSARGRRSG